jgi:hypothetical protein
MSNSKAYSQLIMDLQQSAGLSKAQAEAAAKTIRNKQMAKIKKQKEKYAFSLLIFKLILGCIHARLFFGLLFDINEKIMPNPVLIDYVIHTVSTLIVFLPSFLAWIYIPKINNFLSRFFSGGKFDNDPLFYEADSSNFQQFSSFEHTSLSDSDSIFSNSHSSYNPASGQPMFGDRDIGGNLFGHNHH